jgi:hypothetical protein
MPSEFIYWTSDGGGANGGHIASVLFTWIRTQANPALIVYGGDVYSSGTPAEFDQFGSQVGDLSLVCETPGNHDWVTHQTTNEKGKHPVGYEAFWSAHAPPNSRQPIDSQLKGGGRYEHSHNRNGWQLIFLDTGRVGETSPTWPVDESHAAREHRRQWLKGLTSAAGRSKIIFAHQSRLSRGVHGDNASLQPMWEAALFDSSGHPQVAFTLAGHDHNVGLYRQRGVADPTVQAADAALGIDVLVNGAGGDHHYTFGHGNSGTMPDAGNTVDYCVTEIELIDPLRARVRTLSFGPTPHASTVPVEIPELTVEYDFSP